MKQIRLTFPTSQKKCLISLQAGLFRQIPDLLQKRPYGEKYAIISDSRVAKLYGQKLLNSLNSKGINATLITFPNGETSKNISTVEKIMTRLLQKKFTRHDAILALGGGVTSDLAGFTASTFMRGINYINIPTTLLAMVDASIGGKTGVNLTEGKNLFGTIYQPKEIWIDPELLKTLPKQEFLNGFAEIIKYGIIDKNSIFDLLEKSIQQHRKLTDTTMNTLIEQCVRIKAAIIEKDENEKGKRMLLNYGHTIGHALEQLSDYKISHGQAVTLGIFAINKICFELSLTEEKTALRITKLLRAFKLIQIPPLLMKKIWNPEKLWNIMQNDKKMQQSKISFIIINKRDKGIIYNKIKKSDFIKFFPNKV